MISDCSQAQGTLSCVTPDGSEGIDADQRPDPKNRGRKAAENGVKIRPLPCHRVGNGLGKPETRKFAPSPILLVDSFS